MKKNIEAFKDLTVEIAKDIFKISGISYVIFFILDFLNPGFVVNFLNLNLILIICIISGIITALIYKKNNQ